MARGNMIRVAWIPEQYAKLGKYLELKIDGEWVNGWKVHSVGSRQEQEKVKLTEEAARNHRSVTDV